MPVASSMTVGTKPRKNKEFWLTFMALVACLFLSALDLTAVGTALPTITKDLNGSDNFVWVGSGYSLSSTAILPLSGALADVFGRKPIMLLSVTFFAIGSALAGSARNMNMMIAARVIQGVGGGGILNLSDIIVSDLVPLAERGIYEGLLGLVWAFASGIGPPVGGAFAQKISWRWIFYLNLPFTVTAFTLVIFFMRVRTPEGSVREKIGLVDWTGNVIIIVGTSLAIIGLTWGGIHYPWKSAQVLAPLIGGMCLICFFIYYEAKFPKVPTIPLDIMANRTSFSGYMSTFFHGIVSISMIYYLPVFFQVCLGATPIRSAIDVLPSALVIAPWAFICGAIVQLTNNYRPINALGWMFTIVGFGLLSLLEIDSCVGQWVSFQFISSAGIGILYTSTIFPVLAPLPVSRAASALAFFNFTRSFAQTWGITISGTILQNELKKSLPHDFLSQFPKGVEIAYAAIPKIRALEEPLRSEVRQAFSQSMSTVWKLMAGISGLGVLTLLLLREIPLILHTDEKYGLIKGERLAVASPGTSLDSKA